MWERQFLQVGDTFRLFAPTFFEKVSPSERLPARLRLKPAQASTRVDQLAQHFFQRGRSENA